MELKINIKNYRIWALVFLIVGILIGLRGWVVYNICFDEEYSNINGARDLLEEALVLEGLEEKKEKIKEAPIVYQSGCVKDEANLKKLEAASLANNTDVIDELLPSVISSLSEEISNLYFTPHVVAVLVCNIAFIIGCFVGVFSSDYDKWKDGDKILFKAILFALLLVLVVAMLA